MYWRMIGTLRFCPSGVFLVKGMSLCFISECNRIIIGCNSDWHGHFVCSAGEVVFYCFSIMSMNSDQIKFFYFIKILLRAFVISCTANIADILDNFEEYKQIKTSYLKNHLWRVSKCWPTCKLFRKNYSVQQLIISYAFPTSSKIHIVPPPFI